MRIEENLFVVGSGALGFGLTDPLDCHVYAWRFGAGVVLIDSGSGRAPERIVDALESEGLDPRAVSHVLLTHGHADHAGGAAYWRETFGATVVASEHIADALQAADETAISLDVARRAGMYPNDYEFAACGVDVSAEEVEVLSFSEGDIECISTPGHATGSISYHLSTSGGRRHLFSGDSLFWGGRLALQPIHDCDLGESIASIETLCGLGFEGLFPGHLNIDLSDGKSHALAAMKTLTELQVPANIEGRGQGWANA